MIVPVRIERRVEALQEAHCTQPRMSRRGSAAAQFAHQTQGSDNTHCRIGTRGMTESTRCAAVAAMRLVLQDGQTPRNEAEWLFNSNELQRSHAQPEPCNLPRSVFSQWVSESNG